MPTIGAGSNSALDILYPMGLRLRLYPWIVSLRQSLDGGGAVASQDSRQSQGMLTRKRVAHPLACTATCRRIGICNESDVFNID
jgi:hypothetical protein